MKKRGLTVSCLVMALGLLGVSPTAAQQERNEEMARIRAALPAAVVEQLEQTMTRARTEGLPTGPLVDKALEGIAKGVPGPMIAGAVDRLAVQLGEAHTLLQAGPAARSGGQNAAEVAAVADALRRGVPQQAIRSMAEQAQSGEPLALAVHTLGDLIDEGVPVDQGLAVLEAWRTRGANPQELHEIPAAVQRIIRQGIMPAQAAAAVAGAMKGGASPGAMGKGNNPGAKGNGMIPGSPPVPPGAGPPTDRGRGHEQGGKPGGGSGLI